MKPLKKWEPKYRFGGNPADGLVPPVLGTVVHWRPFKIKSSKKRK